MVSTTVSYDWYKSATDSTTVSYRQFTADGGETEVLWLGTAGPRDNWVLSSPYLTSSSPPSQQSMNYKHRTVIYIYRQVMTDEDGTEVL